ncbi:transmembrane emp24 domain-containing protein bai-like isoform X2 [Melanaphis sacchari]|uniref:transmembrane emp24 domain-containing protein bai-like isoform X2 n=1 Tax=Melanaphis sacchari TaxID=742174 RepID=UPI000DC14DC0|nr:transmembrane emp24 domain-containing protein bai-like isoform X2 [Melanaphis sacchari]XP_025203386.1 transmembrane emp24 domain-containing protein bai-like isoform X2 [Melanaphis sacchari]
MNSIPQLTLLMIYLSLLSIGSSIRWHMQPNNRKCLREELRENILIKGEYEVTQVDNQQVDYVIKDSKNHILSQKEDISSGKFTFSVENYDVFEICFISKSLNSEYPGTVQEIFVDIKTGIEAKNYEGVAEAYKLKPLEMDLKRLEDFSEAIVLEFKDMRIRADEMRNTNETTNKRVFYFSLFSMLCLLILATWQVCYLRRYFKAKKLIE